MEACFRFFCMRVLDNKEMENLQIAKKKEFDFRFVALDYTEQTK